MRLGEFQVWTTFEYPISLKQPNIPEKPA